MYCLVIVARSIVIRKQIQLEQFSFVVISLFKKRVEHKLTQTMNCLFFKGNIAHQNLVELCHWRSDLFCLDLISVLAQVCFRIGQIIIPFVQIYMPFYRLCIRAVPCIIRKRLQAAKEVLMSLAPILVYTNNSCWN